MLRLRGAQAERENPEGGTPRRYNESRLASKARTEKARTTRLLNRQRASLEKRKDLSAFKTVSFSSHLQHWFFTRSFTHAKVQEEAYAGNSKQFDRDRARSVYSLIVGLVSMLVRLFSREDVSNDDAVFHIVNTHIVDDTSTRMRGPSAATDRTSVFTIMNSVQAIHIRYNADAKLLCQGSDENCCLSLRLPTPLLILENADARGIHEHFIHLALVTSNGIGKWFQRFGLDKHLLPQSSWRTFVFVGDSLRANEAAFRLECTEMSKRPDSKHLALKVKCAVHQCCLIRKPVVLMQPGLWTTVTRLSHLFEAMTFRRSFAQTLAALITRSFTYMPVDRLPPASAVWKRASDKLRESFRCQSIMRKRAMNSCLDFLNGDLSSDQVFHFCMDDGTGKQCCTGPDDALGKCLKVVVPFLSRGYQPPLLYRFKHYDEAISYITFASSLHKLLMRTLNAMQGDKGADSEQRHLVDKLLGDADWGSESPGAAETRFNDDFLDENFAAVNAKRKQLVHQEVTKQSFSQSAVLLDFMIQPMDRVINALFARSHHLSQLTLMQGIDENWADLASASRKLFLSIVSGRFGMEIIRQYCEMVTNRLGSLHDVRSDVIEQKSLQTAFTMMAIIVSDVWRRYIHDYAVFPYKLFPLLLDCDLQSFIEQWDRLQGCKGNCSECFDAEMSGRLLEAFPKSLIFEGLEVQHTTWQQVTALLHDLATYTPLSSDPVEVKNGQVQNSTSRRGNTAVKAPVAAKETSFLEALIRDYELVKHWIDGLLLPGKKVVSGILKRVGQPGSNQYSTQPHKATWLVEQSGWKDMQFL